mmetsp:Transcript_89672/g.258537  ORF Transcript_89672/g.258537 Transcript_89672/m.258537 type:complete len:400 (+) Transcript_89672:558-1757(+)
MKDVATQGRVAPPSQVQRQEGHSDGHERRLHKVNANLQPCPLPTCAIFKDIVRVVEQAHQEADHHCAPKASSAPSWRLHPSWDLPLHECHERAQIVKAQDIECPIHLDPLPIYRASVAEVSEHPRESVHHVVWGAPALAHIEGILLALEPSIGDGAWESKEQDLQPTGCQQQLADLHEDARFQDHDEVPTVVRRRRVELHVVPPPEVSGGIDEVPSPVVAPINRPSPRPEDQVHDLRKGQGHAHVHQEYEQVLLAELHPLRPIWPVGSRILVSTEHDETEHVLVVTEDSPYQHLAPRRHRLPGQDGAIWGVAIAQGVNRTPHVVVRQDAQHPKCIASVDDCIFEDGPLGQLLHLPEGIHYDFTFLCSMLIRKRLQLAQVRLTVREPRELGHQNEELRHI